jgi:hypothetical protein
LIFDRHNALLTQKGWIVCDGQTKLIEFNGSPLRFGLAIMQKNFCARTKQQSVKK